MISKIKNIPRPLNLDHDYIWDSFEGEAFEYMVDMAELQYYKETSGIDF